MINKIDKQQRNIYKVMDINARKYSTYCSAWILDGITDNGNSYYIMISSLQETVSYICYVTFLLAAI